MAAFELLLKYLSLERVLAVAIGFALHQSLLPTSLGFDGADIA
jgi:hypothetical protein